MTETKRPYGTGDASFQAAGGYDGLKRLVDDFYDLMKQLPQTRRILSMHPKDLSISRDKLTRFLCGWLGGPRLFSEKYGPITIPGAHMHLDIGTAERDAWLTCMAQAVAKQSFAEDFKIYLLEQLAVPAERIRLMIEKRKAAS